MKIDWKKAPKWAKYCAWDEDGYFSWFSLKPTACDFGRYWDANDGLFENDPLFNHEGIKDWSNSMQCKITGFFNGC